MKNKIVTIILFLAVMTIGSCKKGLLTQSDPNKLLAGGYFTKVSDATSALYGVYVAARECFYKTYAWDGASEMMYSRISARPYSNYTPGNAFGSSVARHWNDAYRCINRANYVIVNVRKMEAVTTNTTDLAQLRRVEGECF